MNAGNRALWIVMSLLLIGLGTVGVLAHYGRLPGTDPDLPLLSPNARERWTSWGTWAMVATIVAGLVLAVLGVVLMRAQLRRRGRADMPDLELRAERAVLAANAPTWPTNAPISPTDRAEPQATGDLAASQPTADPAAGSEPGAAGRGGWPGRCGSRRARCATRWPPTCDTSAAWSVPTCGSPATLTIRTCACG
ncbi:hypothetical protein ACFQX7_37890 [Luedemannella flava]